MEQHSALSDGRVKGDLLFFGVWNRIGAAPARHYCGRNLQRWSKHCTLGSRGSTQAEVGWLAI